MPHELPARYRSSRLRFVNMDPNVEGFETEAAGRRTTSPRGRKILKKNTAATLLPALLLLSLPAACSSSESASDRGGAGGRFRGGGPETSQAVSVKAFRAEQRPISSYILSNTTLESIRKVTVYSRVNALVEELPVEEGDRVRRGEFLARLDEDEIRNEFEQARIAVEQSEIAVQQAQVRAQLSQANFERAKSLFDQTLISQQEFDQAALTNQTDSLALQVAQQQLAANRARLEAAELQLGYTRIVSSIDGVVTERLIEVGSRVSPNQALFTVEDFSPLWARIFVPEKDLPRLRLGKSARLRFQAFPEREFSGAIKMISPIVDAESGTVKVTLEVSRGLDLLRPGMFGTAYIATETRPNAVVIPKRAVLRERDENRVFVIGDDGAVEKRTVELGFSEESFVEIVSGLRPGEAVVTVGQEGLSDGYNVTVLAWENQDGETPAVPAENLVEGGRPNSGESPTPSVVGEQSGPGQGPAAPVRRARRGAGGGPDLERLLQNPQIKAAYEAELEKDPDFMQNPEKRRAFFQKLRELRGRGRP